MNIKEEYPLGSVWETTSGDKVMVFFHGAKGEIRVVYCDTGDTDWVINLDYLKHRWTEPEEGEFWVAIYGDDNNTRIIRHTEEAILQYAKDYERGHLRLAVKHVKWTEGDTS